MKKIEMRKTGLLSQATKQIQSLAKYKRQAIKMHLNGKRPCVIARKLNLSLGEVLRILNKVNYEKRQSASNGL